MAVKHIGVETPKALPKVYDRSRVEPPAERERG
jgi:hypothetical protein